MKITNQTTKIIGIAGVAILPNESATIDVESSMVRHLAGAGKISISDDRETLAGKGKSGKKRAAAQMNESGPEGSANEPAAGETPAEAAG